VQSGLSCPGMSGWVRSKVLLSIVCRGDTAGALTAVLEDAPYGPNVEDAKARSNQHRSTELAHMFLPLQTITLQTLLLILNSTKSTDIPPIVKAISTDAQDTLMKYIYKGMAMPGWGDVSGSVLLTWHEKVCLLSYYYWRIVC